MSASSGTGSKADGGGAPRNAELIRRMLALSWEYRGGCLAVVLLHLLVVVMRIGGLGFFGLGVDFVAHRVQPEENPAPRWPLGLAPPPDADGVAVAGVLAALVAAAALLQGVLTYGTTVATAKLVSQQIVVRLRSQVYDKMQRLSFRFLDASESSSLINRVTRDVQMVRMFVEMCVVQSMTLLVSIAVYATYMLSIHVPLALAALATTPVMWGLTVWYSRMVRPAYMESRRLEDRAVTRFSENLSGAHVVKGFSLEPRETRRFAEANDAVRDQKQWIFWRQTLFMPVLRMLTHVNIIVVLGYGGYLVMQGELPVGAGLVVFAGLLHQFGMQVGNIANIANSLQMSLVGSQRVFEVLDTPSEITSPPNPVSLGRARGDVAFEEVRFAYEQGEWVLDGVNFSVRAGQCVAVLGATGSGKSTLLSLVPRFYDPQQGRVRVDGHDVRELDVDELRRNCGLVFQESFLFSNTIAANIAFGCPEATRGEIERAARAAQAHDFVHALPEGYDTVLGERGTMLSGGQRQRLAIARALLLDPPILLLDDPTAAIDPETEGAMLTAMDAAMTGRTTFVVAHRLSTLRRADGVIVLERGRVAAMGTHEELMQQSALYREAVALQAGDAASRRTLGLELQA